MSKKLLGILLAVCTLLSVAVFAFPASAVETVDGVVQINSEEDMLALMGDSSLWGKSIVLNADLDMKDLAVNGIGNSTTPFTGTFDGQNHTISNLGNILDTTGKIGGLFAYVNGATIKNLTVINNAEYTNPTFAGLVVGTSKSAAGGAEVLNVTTKGSLTVTSTNSTNTGVGGIIGRIYVSKTGKGCVIENCRNEATVTNVSTAATKYPLTGGIIGFVSDTSKNRKNSGNMIIRGCINTGAVSSYKWAGGISGGFRVYYNDSNATYDFSDNLNLGTITVDTVTACGIAAKNNDASTGTASFTFARNVNAGKIVSKAASPTYLQPFLASVPGDKETPVLAADLYYAVDGTTYVAGTAGEAYVYNASATTAVTDMTVASNFTALAESGKWIVVDGHIPEPKDAHVHEMVDNACWCGYSLGCTHPSTTPNVTKAATCHETGLKDIVCDICHLTIATDVEIPIDGNNHDVAKAVYKENAEGKYELTCPCGNVYATVATPVVYVDGGTILSATIGNDRALGTTSEEPVSTLDRAYNLIGDNDGFVYLMDRYTLSGTQTLPAHKGLITISKDPEGSGTGFFTTAHGMILNLNGPTKFENLVFNTPIVSKTTSGTYYPILTLAANWNDLEFGNGITGYGGIYVVVGNSQATKDSGDETKAVTLTMHRVTAGKVDTTGDGTANAAVPFFERVYLMDRYNAAGLVTKNKTVTANFLNNTATNVYYCTSSTAANNCQMENCSVTINIGGDPDSTKETARLGQEIVITKISTDNNCNNAGTGSAYLDHLTLNIKDDAAKIATTQLWNIKDLTVNISGEKDGRITALSKQITVSQSDAYKESEVGTSTEETVTFNYGSHSDVLSADAAYTVTTNVDYSDCRGDIVDAVCQVCGYESKNAYSATLDDVIGLNIYTDNAVYGTSAVATLVNPENAEDRFAPISGVDMGNGTTRYTFNVVPAKIDTTYTFTLSDGAETTYYTKDCSVSGYLGALGETPASNVATALIDYGAYSKAYFANKTEAAAENEALQAVTAETLETYKADVAPVYNKTTIGNLTLVSNSFVFTEAAKTKHYFTLADGGDIAEYTFIYQFTGEDAVTVDAVANGSRYMVTIPGIDAKRLSKTYTLTISKDGEEDLVITYSALSYAYLVLQNSTAETIAPVVPLAKALYLYSVAADAYASAQ